MEVEQVRFDRERVCAEGWTIADVGDGVECFAAGVLAYGHGGDVDAVGGEKFGVRSEVDGRDCVAGAVASSWCRRGGDGVGMTEEGADVADVSFGDELADAAGGYGLAADAAWSVDADVEAEFTAESFEAVDIALCVMAEAKVFSFVQLLDAETFLEDFGGEGAGGHVGEIFGEGKDNDRVDISGGEEC